jgi:hypothetical protein
VLGGLLQVVGLGSRDEGSEVTLRLALDVGDGNDGGSLLVDDCAETGLTTLDDDVGHTELAAEGGQEDDELNGLNVVSNGDELGLLVLDESNDVVQTVLGSDGLGASLGVSLAASGNVLGDGIETCLLLLLRLGAVSVEQLEEVGGGVLVQGVGELANGRWDLQALVEDDLLALQTNVFGPLDEAGQVTRRLDVLADTERLGSLLEAGVLGCLGGGLATLGVGGGSGLLRSRLGCLRLWEIRRDRDSVWSAYTEAGSLGRESTFGIPPATARGSEEPDREGRAHRR